MNTKINQKFNSNTTTNRLKKNKDTLSRRLNLEKNHPKKVATILKKIARKK